MSETARRNVAPLFTHTVERPFVMVDSPDPNDPFAALDGDSSASIAQPSPALVPFGKHRGKPVEILMSDPSYVAWLRGQAWVAERFPAIHTLIINNFGAPEDTPEHNALQLRFLDTALCRQVCEVWIAFCQSRASYWDGMTVLEVTDVNFEVRGVDVLIVYKRQHPDGFYTSEVCSLELKPSLGDDYPSCLRTMLAERGASVLCYERWTSKMPIVQVRQLFAHSGKLLCSLDDLMTFSPATPA